MNFIKKEIELAKKTARENKFTKEQLVNYLADRKTYHTIAIIIFSIIFKEEDVISKKHIYNNSYYSNFKFEKNPFNDDFINEQ
jgi:hypothetical protein